MAKYIVSNEDCSIEILKKNNLYVEDYGCENEVIFDDMPICSESGKLLIIFKGNRNKVHIKGNVNINGSVECIFDPQPNMLTDGCLIEIGENTIFNGFCQLLCAEKNTNIYIGNSCLFAARIYMRTGDGHTIYDLSTRKKVNCGADIMIGNHVWICSGVKILKGSNVSKDSIVGSDSLVNKKFLDGNVVIAGNPAKIVRTNVNWDIKCGWNEDGQL